jgi:NADH:ubiquinone oxidoreductase subunit E
MSRSRQQIVAAVLVFPAALVLLASAGGLIADYLITRRHAPADKERITALEQAAKKDLSQVPVLVDELDRQTKLSLRRVGRQKVATGALIVASLLFLSSAKWFIWLRGRPVVTLSTIAAMRQSKGFGVQVRLRRDSPRRGSRFRSPQATRRREARGSDGSPVPGCARESAPGSGVQTVSPPPTLDLSFVDEVVAREGRGSEAAIPILQAIQSHYGYLPDEALKRVCQLTEIRPAQIAGVSSFYAQFRRTPAGKHIIKVCHGTACHVSGARQITEEVRRYLAIAPEADTDPQRVFTVDKVACLGCCSLAPVLMIDEHTVGRLTPVQACEAIEAFCEQEAGT